MKILVVDDSYSDFKLAENIYNSENINIEILYAKDGIQALHELNKNDLPDIILLDIGMPQLDGVDFLRRIRKFKALNDIKVIVTSAMNSDDYPELKNLNISAYEQKPIPLEKYLNFIN